MTSPFIFIGTYEFQPGKAEDFKTYWKEFWSTVVEPQEPRLLAFNAYVDADNKRVTVIAEALTALDRDRYLHRVTEPGELAEQRLELGLPVTHQPPAHDGPAVIDQAHPVLC